MLRAPGLPRLQPQGLIVRQPAQTALTPFERVTTTSQYRGLRGPPAFPETTAARVVWASIIETSTLAALGDGPEIGRASCRERV